MTRRSLGMVWGLALAAAPTPLLAQQATADALRQARAYYEQLDVERALPVLRRILSPAWPATVSPDERVEACLYLAAALTLSGQRDSAIAYFQTALRWNAFTDLDVTRFTPAQLTLFAEARRRTFAIGVRPIPPSRFDPRTARLPVTVVSTHTAALTVTLRPISGNGQTVLFQGSSDGLRQFDWNGLLDDGRMAPPGRYRLSLEASSALRAESDTTDLYFDLAHDVAPLEDTLPPLDPASFLPERRSAARATGSLATGFAVAALTFAIADGLSNPDLGHALPAGAGVVTGAAAVAGGVTFVLGRRHRDIPENVAANERRRAERTAANAGVVQRNADRIAATVLVITPAAGVGP